MEGSLREIQPVMIMEHAMTLDITRLAQYAMSCVLVDSTEPDKY